MKGHCSDELVFSFSTSSRGSRVWRPKEAHLVDIPKHTIHSHLHLPPNGVMEPLVPGVSRHQRTSCSVHLPWTRITSRNTEWILHHDANPLEQLSVYHWRLVHHNECSFPRQLCRCDCGPNFGDGDVPCSALFVLLVPCASWHLTVFHPSCREASLPVVAVIGTIRPSDSVHFVTAVK